MKKGKLIIIEGTDCSGKETQANLLIKNLRAAGVKCGTFSFPCYDSPTGKIIAGPYLAKPQYNIEGYFPEGAANVLPEVAILYYAADRKYNINKITNMLNSGVNVILDRYIDSNSAHQASKAKDNKERKYITKLVYKLEYGLLKLPKPDLILFLHMPVEVTTILKKNRVERADQHERDITHLEKAEQAYLYLAKVRKFKTINCADGLQPRKIDDISRDVFNLVSKHLKIKQ